MHRMKVIHFSILIVARNHKRCVAALRFSVRVEAVANSVPMARRHGKHANSTFFVIMNRRFEVVCFYYVFVGVYFVGVTTSFLYVS